MCHISIRMDAVLKMGISIRLLLSPVDALRSAVQKLITMM